LKLKVNTKHIRKFITSIISYIFIDKPPLKYKMMNRLKKN
jgi:hypothetical protein